MAVAYNPGIVTDGLVLCLDAANRKSYPRTGTGWTDLSGTENNGTLVNGPTFNSTNQGYFSFDGIDDAVTCPTINLGNGNLAWTASAWIRTATTTNTLGHGAVMSNSSGGPVWSVMGVNGGNIVYWTYHTSAWNQTRGVAIVNDSKWHFLSWVNYTNNTMDMYVDGLFDKNVSNSTSGNNNPINIIGRSWAALSLMDIAFVNIYNFALSSQQISQNFNALRGRFGI